MNFEFQDVATALSRAMVGYVPGTALPSAGVLLAELYGEMIAKGLDAIDSNDLAPAILQALQTALPPTPLTPPTSIKE